MYCQIIHYLTWVYQIIGITFFLSSNPLFPDRKCSCGQNLCEYNLCTDWVYENLCIIFGLLSPIYPFFVHIVMTRLCWPFSSNYDFSSALHVQPAESYESSNRAKIFEECHWRRTPFVSRYFPMRSALRNTQTLACSLAYIYWSNSIHVEGRFRVDMGRVIDQTKHTLLLVEGSGIMYAQAAWVYTPKRLELLPSRKKEQYLCAHICALSDRVIVEYVASHLLSEIKPLVQLRVSYSTNRGVHCKKTKINTKNYMLPWAQVCVAMSSRKVFYVFVAWRESTHVDTRSVAFVYCYYA
jgi:hypothetical protein